MSDIKRNSFRPVFRLFLLALMVKVIPGARAQQAPGQVPADFLPKDFRISYAYAAVMGTGTYKIDGREISQLRIPFRLTQRRITEGEFGVRWFVPVSVGYDGVKDNNWLDRVFDDNLVTATVMPGFQAQIPLDETWTIKPAAMIGVTRDFTRNQTVYLASTGVQARATWHLDNDSELRWGMGLHLVGEYQNKGNQSNGFSILETGLDYRRDTKLWVLERKTNAGAYFTVQRFTPVWDVTDTPIGESEVDNLYEVGISLGLKKPQRMFRVWFNRVRLGYKFGSGLNGWSIGGDFPI